MECFVYGCSKKFFISLAGVYFNDIISLPCLTQSAFLSKFSNYDFYLI